MKHLMVRLDDKTNEILVELSKKTGMSYVEIVTRGILSVDVMNTVDNKRDHRKMWSEGDMRVLRVMKKNGSSVEDIANALGRTKQAVYHKHYKLEV